MRLSFGGDSAYYLSVLGIIRAIEEVNLEIDEIHCTGFSCIPLFFSEYLGSPGKAYPKVRELYKEIVKIFKFLKGLVHIDVVNLLLTLYRMQKGIEGTTSQKSLVNFIYKSFPNVDLEKIPRLKIHAFNLKEYKDEILSGNVREALCSTLCFPIQFSPYKDYITGAWVYGVPEGDIIITMKSEDIYKPRNAIDYMILSTLGRTKEIVEIRKQEADFSFEFEVNSLDPSRNSLKIYEAALEKFAENVLKKD